jgi:hypothetical protein
MYLSNRTLVECNCDECQGKPPISLGYHELMKHSVRVRAAEIEEWASVGPSSAADKLEYEFEFVARAVPLLGLPSFVRSQVERSYEHIPRWVAALRLLA